MRTNFDIARDAGDIYRITLAMAGCRPDEIDIVAQQNQLTVTGKSTEDKDDGQACAGYCFIGFE